MPIFLKSVAQVTFIAMPMSLELQSSHILGLSDEVSKKIYHKGLPSCRPSSFKVRKKSALAFKIVKKLNVQKCIASSSTSGIVKKKPACKKWVV